MHRVRAVAALALGALFLSLSVAGADDKDKKDRKGDGGAISDEQFVQKASAAGLAEVNASLLAMRMAQSPDVKMFAKRMVDDHAKANMELNNLADRKGLRPAATMGPKHQEMAQRMARLSGADFDREYMAAQVKAHEAAVSLFESFSKGGEKDDALRQWAGRTLPALQDHLKMARDLADRTKAGGREGERTRTDRAREDTGREKAGTDKTRDQPDRDRKDRPTKEDRPDKGNPNPNP
jgi:putative membrane protein